MITLDHLHAIAPWAAALEPDSAERARRGIVERVFAKGAYICHQDDRFECWTGVVEGLVKLSTVSRSGKAVTFAGLPTGAWFGEGSVLKGEPRRYDLVALRETRLALMEAATFHWLNQHSAAFNRFLVHQLNERLGQFIGLVQNDRMLDASSRVARALAQLFNPHLHPSVGTHLGITQEELGLLSGLSRQVTNQSLSRLESAGVLRVERGGVSIDDWRELLRYEPEARG